MSYVVRIVALCAVLAVSAAALGVFTASNTVPATNLGQQQIAITANQLKPAACSAINLVDVIWATTTTVTGTAGNDLILARGTATTLTGGGGVDCMIGGAGVDSFNGNGKSAGDVCIGNGGTDINSSNKCTNFTQ